MVGHRSGGPALTSSILVLLTIEGAARRSATGLETLGEVTLRGSTPPPSSKEGVLGVDRGPVATRRAARQVVRLHLLLLDPN